MAQKHDRGTQRDRTDERKGSMRREGRKEGGERDGKNKRRKQKGTQLNCHSKVGVADQERLDDGGQEGGGGLGPSGEEDAQGFVLPLGVSTMDFTMKVKTYCSSWLHDAFRLVLCDL